MGCLADAPHDPSIPVFQVDSANPVQVLDGITLGGFARIDWAGRATDGTIFVADGRLSEVAAFPTQGDAFVVARQGEGPNEVPYVVDATLYADSVIVSTGPRLSVFTPQGVFARAIPSPRPGDGAPSVLGAIGDSHLALVADQPTLRPGLVLDSAILITIDLASGAVRDTVRLPYRWSYFDEFSGGAPIWVYPPPFFGRAVVGVLDSLVVWGMGDRPLLWLLDPRGNRVDSIPVAIPERRLSRATVEQALDERLTGASEPERRRDWQRVFDDLAFPARHPFYDALIVGPEGMLWLRVAESTQTETREWWAHTRRGTPTRRLRLPASIELTQILDSLLVGIQERDDGDQRVVVLRPVPAGG